MLRVSRLIATWIVLAAPAAACSCAPQPSRGVALRTSDFVFVGTVVSYGPTDLYLVPNVPLYAVTVEVDEVIGGFSATSQRTVRAGALLSLSQGQGVDCEFVFETGQQYLIYTRRFGGLLLNASACGRTALASEAEDEIAALRADVASGTTLYRYQRGDDSYGAVRLPEAQFDSLAAYAASAEARARQRLAWSVGLNGLLALGLAVAAARSLRRR